MHLTIGHVMVLTGNGIMVAKFPESPSNFYQDLTETIVFLSSAEMCSRRSAEY